MLITEIFSDFKLWVLAFFKPKNTRFRYNPHEQPTAGKYSQAMLTLITINVVVYFALLVLNITPFYDDVTEWLVGHTAIEQITARPWSILTYGFVHVGFIHFAMNMFAMIAYIREVKLRLSERQIYFLYFAGVLIGAGACILYTHTYSKPNFYVGASAGIYALITYTFLCSMNKRMSIFGLRFKAATMLYFILGLDIVMCIFDNNGGGSASHLGGVALAWFFHRMQQKNMDMSVVLQPFSKLFTMFGKKKKYVDYKSKYSTDFEDMVRRTIRQQ
jgi:membrane associated rhomboid family serine protease